jgi:hypothetical protein
MNTERVREIIKDSLWSESFGVDDATPEGCEVVDLIFFKAGFDKSKAVSHAEELRGIISDTKEVDQWVAGPSYIHVGGWMGDQRDALLLIALGHVAGIWKATTPLSLGRASFDAEKARELAGAGFVYATEFTPLDK